MRKIGRKLLSGDSRFYFVVRSSERSTLVFYTKAQNSGCGDTSCFNRCFLSLSLSLSLSLILLQHQKSRRSMLNIESWLVMKRSRRGTRRIYHRVAAVGHARGSIGRSGEIQRSEVTMRAGMCVARTRGNSVRRNNERERESARSRSWSIIERA